MPRGFKSDKVTEDAAFAAAQAVDKPIDVPDPESPLDEPQVEPDAVTPEDVMPTKTTHGKPQFEIVDEIPPIQQKKLAYDDFIDFVFDTAATHPGKAVRVPNAKGKNSSPTSAASTLRTNYGDTVRNVAVLHVTVDAEGNPVEPAEGEQDYMLIPHKLVIAQRNDREEIASVYVQAVPAQPTEAGTVPEPLPEPETPAEPDGDLSVPDADSTDS